MVLQRSNFEIPARFSFQPFSADWRLETAETVEWVEKPTLQPLFSRPKDDPEKNWLRVRIGVLGYGSLDALYRIDDPSWTVLMDRASIPPDVLQPHENHRNTPDVSGRSFQVLICQKPEFKDGLWALKPGEVTKNAWVMCNEFLKLEADPELGWDWSARRFLNKWGIWESGKGYSEDWVSRPLAGFLPPSTSVPEHKDDRPDFVLVSPHLLKEQQEKYAKDRLPSNRLPWLRSHPLSLDTAVEFPFFRVRKSCCADAIEATITIDHLAGLEFGICKRCHKSFQKETRHKKKYCSEPCFNAAGVQRWREKQRKEAKKGAKRNAKA